MNPEKIVDDAASLLTVWVAGWAACRGFSTAPEGRFPSALRTDRDSAWEYFAYEPTEEEFTGLAAKTAAAPGRILTILSDDALRYSAMASKHGLALSPVPQMMMLVDMTTQDAEDPWLADDDLSLETSYEDGIYRAVVRSDTEVAASGQMSVVDSTAVFDKIETDAQFQRRGLGSLIMKALAAQAPTHDVTEGLLLASADGQKLYSHLGWNSLTPVMMFSVAGDEGDLSLS
ncbi:GNAT family N-acetyltransferase [Pseudarthrobacter sp. PS3-L1]|uniref:GNAT family N-acetyltransferase n=1 Tax=Pseudarthrobacter sp. PS3-L1 TaxID=3046207 RepID=UPI0024BA9182|nr:GNAT family N-acetyltransferase [Pseudarthrobacter sp. PS3-L1]MDJ0319221.1 GNAT family N-acetyltransferase [Pseudarthrobacter sp. PS3-L1]